MGPVIVDITVVSSSITMDIVSNERYGDQKGYEIGRPGRLIARNTMISANLGIISSCSRFLEPIYLPGHSRPKQKPN